MAKSIALVLLALVLVTSCASALQVYKHEVDIFIDGTGNAEFAERYFISFLAGELEAFKTDASQNSSSLLAWQVDFNWFRPHFSEDAIKSAHITFDERLRVLTLDYTASKPIAAVVREEPRATMWQIPDREFRSYTQGAAISIPDTTAITVTLPFGSQIDTSQLFAEAQVAGNVVVLSGISTNRLNLAYSIPKPIAPTLNIFDYLTQANLVVVLIVVAVALVVVYANRRKIGAKIEKYIIEHSEIEGREPEEEVDIEA